MWPREGKGHQQNLKFKVESWFQNRWELNRNRSQNSETKNYRIWHEYWHIFFWKNNHSKHTILRSIFLIINQFKFTANLLLKNPKHKNHSDFYYPKMTTWILCLSYQSFFNVKNNNKTIKNLKIIRGEGRKQRGGKWLSFIDCLKCSKY